MFTYSTTAVVPSVPFDAIFKDFEDLLFKDVFNRSAGWNSCYNAKIDYPVDIKHNDDVLEIDIAAGGIDKEQIKIDLDGEILTVSYDAQKEETSGWKYISKKIKNGSFKFAWNLSDVLDVEQLKARVENGIVKITIPMKAESNIKKRSVNIE